MLLRYTGASEYLKTMSLIIPKATAELQVQDSKTSTTANDQ